MTPTRPGRICATPGCPRIVTKGSHCTEHEQTRRRKDPEQARFYRTSWWRKRSEDYRRRHSICQNCNAQPSKVTDHRDGNWQHNEESNYQALCKDCNATKTARQHRAKHAGGA